MTGRADADRSAGTDWGYVGFMASLGSFASCGYLSPVALVLSIMGLRRYPFGYAITGGVLSVVQLAHIAFVGLTPFWMIICTGVAGTAALAAGKKILE